MREELYENKNKNELLDRTNKHINETIDYGIQYDYLDYVFPILSKMELKKDSEFFKTNSITINPDLDLSSRELKTISYLAPFYKEKIKYNPKDIIRYLYFLGYLDVTTDDYTILCLDKKKEYTDKRENYITFEEYLKLSYYSVYEITSNIAETSVYPYKAIINTKTQSADNLYIDGFNTLFDREMLK